MPRKRGLSSSPEPSLTQQPASKVNAQSDDHQPPGHRYQNVTIGGSSRAHLGDVHNEVINFNLAGFAGTSPKNTKEE
jgi:hypothetical protein